MSSIIHNYIFTVNPLKSLGGYSFINFIHYSNSNIRNRFFCNRIDVLQIFLKPEIVNSEALIDFKQQVLNSLNSMLTYYFKLPVINEIVYFLHQYFWVFKLSCRFQNSSLNKLWNFFCSSLVHQWVLGSLIHLHPYRHII